jgi:membrane-associated protease RseP (regulator of RpoE activity)
MEHTMTVGAMMKTEGESAAPDQRRWFYAALLIAAVVACAFFWPDRLIFFGLLVLSIVWHELGHFLGARWGGMKATEFFVGFGPRIWSFRRGETEFGIKPIVLGGYVKTPGMHNLDEVDEADESRTYRHQTYGRRVRMVFAGPLMNLAIALVGFCIVFAVADEQIALDPVRVAVVPGGAAESAGVISGDVIVEINGAAIENFDDLRSQVEPNPGAPLAMVVERGGERVELTGTMGTAQAGKTEVGRLNVEWDPVFNTVSRNPAQAVQRGFTEFGSQIWLQTKGIAEIFSPSGLNRVFETVTGQREDDGQRASSLVGISKIGGEAVKDGWIATLELLTVLNLALGLFNLLPILPFDGGHILIATFERIRQRAKGPSYRVDFAKVVPYFAPLIMVVLFVVMSAVILDIKA